MTRRGSSDGVHPSGSYRRAALSVAVTAVLLGWTASRIDVGGAASILADAHLAWLVVPLVLGPVQIALGAERWRLASEAAGVPLPGDVARSELTLSAALNGLLPGGVTGDAIRVWRQRHGGPVPALRAAVSDRAAGLGVHLTVTAVGLVAWPWMHGVAPPIALWPVVAVPLLGALAWRPPARWVGLSVAQTASFVVAYGACGLAVGVAPGGWWISGVPLVLLAMIAPVSVGGWGPREATAAALLPLLGLSPEQAVATSALYGVGALLGFLPALALWRPTVTLAPEST